MNENVRADQAEARCAKAYEEQERLRRLLHQSDRDFAEFRREHEHVKSERDRLSAEAVEHTRWVLLNAVDAHKLKVAEARIAEAIELIDSMDYDTQRGLIRAVLRGSSAAATEGTDNVE